MVNEDGTIDVDADPLYTKLLQTENHNKRATQLLQLNGYNGSSLKKLAPRLDPCKIKTCVTAPHSCERKHLLAKATTEGSRFHATGIKFLNSDDFFIVEDRNQSNGGMKILKTKKEQHKTQKIHEPEGKAAIKKLSIEKINMRILKRMQKHLMQKVSKCYTCGTMERRQR